MHKNDASDNQPEMLLKHARLDTNGQTSKGLLLCRAVASPRDAAGRRSYFRRRSEGKLQGRGQQAAAPGHYIMTYIYIYIYTYTYTYTYTHAYIYIYIYIYNYMVMIMIMILIIIIIIIICLQLRA